MDSATEVLFNGRVPITVKQPSTTTSLTGNQVGSIANDAASSAAAVRHGHQAKAEPVLVQQRRHGITVQISLASRQAGRSKVLEVQLTDETDPFFLFQLDIGEEDFHCLKNEQNLLVDFQAFPVKFIELLEECIRCRNDDHPKYIAQLMSETPSRHSVLSIIETNTFKHIAHLSLNFVPGNDVNVKQYLANLVKEYKSEISSLRMQLETTNTTLLTRLKEQESLARSLATELEKVKMTSSEGSSKLLLQHAEEMSRERERASRDLENLRRETEREQRNLEQQYEEQIRNLSQKHTSVSATHSHLISHTQTLESALASANKQLETLTQDHQALRQDFDKTSSRANQLEKGQSEMDRELESLRGKLREYERREREKEDENRRLNDLLENANDQNTKWEDSLNLYKTQNSRMEDAFKKATDEINKGNEIIQRLQNELRAAKSKIKLKNVVTLQQEKLLDERAHSLETQQKEINTLKETMTKKQEDLDSAQRRAEELQKRLDESKQIIEDNGNVIEWLHKQLNDDAIHRPPMSAPSAVGGLSGGAYGHIDFDKFAVSTASRTGHDFGGNSELRRSGLGTGSLGYRTRFEDNGVASQSRYATQPGTGSTSGIPQITYRGSLNGAKQRQNLSYGVNRDMHKGESLNKEIGLATK